MIHTRLGHLNDECVTNRPRSNSHSSNKEGVGVKWMKIGEHQLRYSGSELLRHTSFKD